MACKGVGWGGKKCFCYWSALASTYASWLFTSCFSYIECGIWKRRSFHSSLVLGTMYPTEKNFQCKYRISLSKESKYLLHCLYASRINSISSSGGCGLGNLSQHSMCTNPLMLTLRQNLLPP